MKKGISFENISFRYNSGTSQLKNITFHIPQGTFLGITGVNGSGKTTLSLLLNSLIPHEISGELTGDIFIDDVNTRTHSVGFFARKVGMVFQNPDFMLFNLSASEEIAFGLKNFKLPVTPEVIANSLALVGLAGFENRDPQTLSLGEKQKLTLACILALDTPYIVLDEPVAMLDYQGAVNLYTLLEKLNKKEGKTIIVIEHDTDFLLTYTQQMLVLDKGKILFEGSTKKVFKNKEKLKELGIKIPHSIR